VADSVVVQWGNFNAGWETFARLLTTWLQLHPEVSVRTTQNALFYPFCTALTWGSIFAVGLALPLLITRDLSSNAIIIYASKAVSRFDYLLGKFATLFGLLVLTWIGPVCAAWFLGNLLAPNWGFFWHSRAAFGHAMLYGLTSACILGLLALGVSAISSREKSTAAFWFIWWMIGPILARISDHTQPWLKHLSFDYNLRQLAQGIFRLGDDLKLAQDTIPIFGEYLRTIHFGPTMAYNAPEFWSAVLGLAVMLGLAVWVIQKRVRPE